MRDLLKTVPAIVRGLRQRPPAAMAARWSLRHVSA